MFIDLFYKLRQGGIPVSITEYLSLLNALDAGVAGMDIDSFYYLLRTTMVKDERHFDRFDRIFGAHFTGLEDAMDKILFDIPAEWLRKYRELDLTEEERRRIESLGGWEALMETLRKRLAEQNSAHRGGNKMLGTAGTSPFGAYGYHSEGIRVGQDQGRHRRAVKVWDRREYKNLDDKVELGTRNIKVALRALRKFAREGASAELDLEGTIQSTAEKAGLLDIKMVPERHNAVKVLLFLDVGGSMDDHIRACQALFSASHSEFKHLEYFYFHNCLYERVWRNNRRRHSETIPLMDILHKYGHDHKVIIVGDASMSPYEIIEPGGSVEHWNDEPGSTWMTRLLTTYPYAIWLNPVAEKYWRYTASIEMIKEIMRDRMYPLTIDGISRGIETLKRQHIN